VPTIEGTLELVETPAAEEMLKKVGTLCNSSDVNNSRDSRAETKATARNIESRKNFSNRSADNRISDKWNVRGRLQQGHQKQ
jgi:hypothetical protein